MTVYRLLPSLGTAASVWSARLCKGSSHGDQDSEAGTMIDCALISQAIAAYDPDAQEASVVKAEEQRGEFLARFPKEAGPR